MHKTKENQRRIWQYTNGVHLIDRILEWDMEKFWCKFLVP